MVKEMIKTLEGRVAIVGATTPIGHALQQQFPRAKLFDAEPPKGSLIQYLDTRNLASIEQALQQMGPEHMVINVTGYDDVNGAEAQGKQDAMQWNVTGPRNLKLWMQRSGVRILHVSKAYVFDGTKGEPYTEKDKPNPINTYGRQRLTGELALLGRECRNPLVVVMRTDDLYGPGVSTGINLLIAKAESQLPLTVITDQLRSPTLTTTLARVIREFVEKWDIFPSLGGQIYHAASRDGCSRAEFAQAIVDRLTIPHRIRAVTTAEYDRLFRKEKSTALRPQDCRLSTEKLAKLGIVTPSWREDLGRHLAPYQGTGTGYAAPVA